MIANPKSYSNRNIIEAAKNKNDEFYTLRSDIDKEMATYTDYDPDVFRDKVILLPCDDPAGSEFTAHFLDRFEDYRAKAVVSTCYRAEGKGAYLIHTANRHYAGELQGDGDFRSREVSILRDKADIVITNPPFSLFTEFVAWIANSGKMYSVIGTLVATVCQDVFPHVKSGSMRLGNSIRSHGMEFRVPPEYPITAKDSRTDGQGHSYITVSTTRWFTNIPAEPTAPTLVLTELYDPSKHLKYDNYDAINVNRVCDIPKDYGGVIGVPVSYMDKHDPSRFEIVGSSKWRGQDPAGYYGRKAVLDGKEMFARIFIRRRVSG